MVTLSAPLRLEPAIGRHVRQGGRRAGVIPRLVVVLLLLAGGAGLAHGAAWRGGWHPALPADRSASPLGIPVQAPAGGGGYQILHDQDDGTHRPVAWDPCRPIHFVVRSEGSPSGGREAVDWALARMTAVTGLHFVDDGATDEVPRADRPAADRNRYGQRWSPVLIAWTDAKEYPGMEKYAALGGPVAVDGEQRGARRYVSGVVLLNRTHLTEIATREDGQRILRAVVLHELGHVVGLDHVEGRDALMSPRPGVTAFDLGPGDLRGLVRLSHGPCFTDF